MKDRNFNYYQEILEEGKDFYGDLYQFEKRKEEFNGWASKNLIHLATVETVEDVSPIVHEVNRFVKLGYDPSKGGCHFKSRQITLLSKGEYKHYTGFIYSPNTSIYPFFTHSFNVLEGKVVDFDRLDESSHKPLQPERYKLPFEYYGFEIPLDFVKKMEDDKEFSFQRPLLVAYLEEIDF